MIQLPDSLLRFALLSLLAFILPSAAAQLSGTVLGPKGGPIENARVELEGGLLRSGLRKALGETQTDASGAFAFPDAEGETLLVRANAPGFATAGQFLNRADSREGIELHCAQGWTIQGVVLCKEDGAPIANVRIEAGLARTRSDESGAFHLTGLAQTADQVTLIRRGYVPRFVSIASEPQAIGSSVRWEMSKGAAVEARVLGAISNLPVAGVEVRAQVFMAPAYTAIEQGDYGALTGADGVARVGGLPPGQPIVLEAFSPKLGWAQGTVLTAGRPAGGDMDYSKLLLSKDGRLELTVTDDLMQPVKGATVRILPLVEPLLNFGDGASSAEAMAARRSGTTDRNGVAVFEALPLGTFSIQVHARGYSLAHDAIRMRHGEVAKVVIDLLVEDEVIVDASPWAQSLRAAFIRANAEKVPVLFSLARDDERASDYMATHHYRGEGFRQLAKLMPVVLINNHGQGGLPSVTPHAEVDGVCSRYGGGPCSMHQFATQFFLSELIEPGQEVQVPQQLVVGPDGDRLIQRDFLLTERDLEWLMMRALILTRMDLAQAESVKRLRPIWRRLLGSSPEALEASRTLAHMANAGDQFALALLPGLRGLGVSTKWIMAVIGGLNPEVIQQSGEALIPLLSDRSKDVSLVVLELLSRKTTSEHKPLNRRSVPMAMALSQILSTGDSGERGIALRLLDIDRGRHPGGTLTLNRADDEAALLAIEALLRTCNWDQLLGTEAMLLRGEPCLRARLLRVMAARTEDSSARTRVFQAARWKDWRSVPAINALRACPLLHHESGQLSELIARHRNSSFLVRAAMRNWLQTLAETGHLEAQEALAAYSKEEERLGSER